MKKRLAAVVLGLALIGVVAPAASAAEATPALNTTAYPVCYTRVPVLNVAVCVPWAL